MSPSDYFREEREKKGTRVGGPPPLRERAPWGVCGPRGPGGTRAGPFAWHGICRPARCPPHTKGKTCTVRRARQRGKRRGGGAVTARRWKKGGARWRALHLPSLSPTRSALSGREAASPALPRSPRWCRWAYGRVGRRSGGRAREQSHPCHPTSPSKPPAVRPRAGTRAHRHHLMVIARWRGGPRSRGRVPPVTDQCARSLHPHEAEILHRLDHRGGRAGAGPPLTRRRRCSRDGRHVGHARCRGCLGAR